MVPQKRVEYGFDGYQMPPIPRAARSARRRGAFKRQKDETQMCGFDLLANIAGKLLSESDSMDMSNKKQFETAYDSVKEEKQDEDKYLEASGVNNGINRNFIVSDLVLGAPYANGFSKELPCTQGDACSGPASVITTPQCSGKVASTEQLVNGEVREAIESNTDIELFGCRVSPGCKLEGESNKIAEVELNDPKLAINKSEIVCNSKCQMNLDSSKPFGLGSSDNSHKFSLSKDHAPCGSLPFSRENLNLVVRDDDEKLSWCTHPSTKNKACKPSPRIGDRRIRKILASKYWNVTPDKNDEEHLSSGDAEKKHMSHNGKYGSKLLRSQKDYPFKKRKLYDWSSVSNSDCGTCNDGTCKSPGKGFDGYASASVLPSANGTSTSAAREHASFQSKNPHVKLKIRSFRVPEFFIEISETATVGSLKVFVNSDQINTILKINMPTAFENAVMEAVTAILSGGLHVGVLLQGKKIRDDNKTLLQSGISHNNKLDALGFTLEPNTTQTPQPRSPEDHPLLLPCDAPEPLSRYPPMAVTSLNAEFHGTCDALPDPCGTNINNFIESDHDSAPSPDMSFEKITVDSRALVAIPTMSVEALSAVPKRKSKRSEAAQRRIRRPFSVSEVEALVQAVEKLGTGRWRDVKLLAFENVKHRTYVDLKDKWKTLVHTARISPQQRRGEPVPQELLDRVLAAHAYWTQQQFKQQFKTESDNGHVF